MTGDTGSTWLLGLEMVVSDVEGSPVSSEASKSMTVSDDTCMPF